MYNILIKPIVTEKITAITENEKKYGFFVDTRANKIEIAKAVSKRFEVTVVAVNTVKYKGKRKSMFTKRGKLEGKKPAFKKAIVTLKEGDTIDLFGEV